MAISKLFLIISTILLSNQIEPIASNDVDDTDIVDIIKRILIAVDSIIDTVLGEAAQNVSNIINDYDFFQEVLVDKINQIVKEVVDRSLEVLNAISLSTPEEGKKLAKCVIDTEPDIMEVFNNLGFNVSTCVKEDLVKLGSDSVDMLNKLIALQNEARNIIQDLDECAESDLSCALKIVDQLFEILKKVPEVVAPYINQIDNDIDAVEATYNKCFLRALPNVYLESGRILQNIALCSAASTLTC